MVKKTKKEKPKFFYLAILLFVVSASLLIIGLMGNKDGVLDENKTPLDSEKVSEEDLLINYFEGVDRSNNNKEGDALYYESDPFKDACDDTSGDGKPSIKSGTVCYR